MNLPKHYSLYDSSYGDEISGEMVFTIKYSKIPSSRSDKATYTKKTISLLISDGFKLIWKNEYHVNSLSTDIHERYSEEYLYCNDDKEIIIRLKRPKNNEGYIMTVMYSIENGPLEDQMDFSKIEKNKAKKKKSNISLIKSQNGYIDLEEYTLQSPKTDLGLNYGEDFRKIHNTIIKRLNSQRDKGIVLLHGEPGTGKTTYIKYITTLIDDKEIIFVPPMMAESLTDPSIIPFLMEHKNSVLIIEDAERVLASREGSGVVSQSTSNLLNLTDGILGDCLNIQIVATFNTKRDNIDEAFMRKGRLIAEHKFNKLSVENSNRLLKQLGKDVTVDEPMALSDIYNIDEDVHKSMKDKQKIGF